MKKFVKQVRENWIFIVLLFALTTWYAGTNARLTQAEQDIRDLKELVNQINDMKVQIQRIDTSVQFIKDRLQ